MPNMSQITNTAVNPTKNEPAESPPLPPALARMTAIQPLSVDLYADLGLPFRVTRFENGRGVVHTLIVEEAGGRQFQLNDCVRPQIVKAVLKLVEMYAALKAPKPVEQKPIAQPVPVPSAEPRGEQHKRGKQ